MWLREECKPFEHRTALTPEICKELIAQGFEITVEKRLEDGRCVPDQDYADAGCTLVDTASWTEAPEDFFIVGLKELPEDGSALKHKHIFFGHAYKNQAGWKDLLGRFASGGGTLLDLEYLTNEKGQRVAAFGFMAGYAGAAVGLLEWCQQQLQPDTPMAAVMPYPNKNVLIEAIKEKFAAVEAKVGSPTFPKVLIMGALGRSGSGAVALCEDVGIPAESMSKWDIQETKGGGPFEAILDHDMFINCIYLLKKIPPFITEDMLANEGRKLKTVVDVSCDTSNPNNPIPFANQATTFDAPTLQLSPPKGSKVSMIAIDHLPAMLPLESSQMYSADLKATIEALKKIDAAPVWVKATTIFKEKSAEAKL